MLKNLYNAKRKREIAEYAYTNQDGKETITLYINGKVSVEYDATGKQLRAFYMRMYELQILGYDINIKA